MRFFVSTVVRELTGSQLTERMVQFVCDSWASCCETVNISVSLSDRKIDWIHDSASFYRWNQFKVISLACTVRTRNLSSNFLHTYSYDVRRELTTR